MVLHNHGYKNGGHGHHSYEENIMMIRIIPYIASPLPMVSVNLA